MKTLFATIASLLLLASAGTALGQVAAPITTLSLSSSALDFGNTVISPCCLTQSVTVSNTGANPLVVSTITLSGVSVSNYLLQFETCTALPVVVSGSCTIRIAFEPTATGIRNAQLNINANTATSPEVITLTGNGVPALVASPLSVDFGSVTSGASSSVQTVTISLVSGVSCLDFNAPTISGPDSSSFAIVANTCSTIPPRSLYSGSCTADLRFDASGGNALKNATMTISASYGLNCRLASPPPPDPLLKSAALTTMTKQVGQPVSVSVSLSGTVGAGSAPVIDLSLGSIDFGIQGVGTTSAPQIVTLSNVGTLPLTINGFTTTSDFGYTSNCPLTPATLAAGGTCTVNITFSPLTATALSGFLLVNSDAVRGSSNVLLLGQGANIPLPNLNVSTNSLAFGSQAIGSTSAIQSVIVTNTGTATLIINNIALNSAASAAGFTRIAGPANPIPPNPAIPATTLNCGGSLAPAASCYISVIFSPTGLGSVAGGAGGLASLIITHNATSSGFGTTTRSIALTGDGTARREPIIRVTGGNSGINNANVNFADQVIGTIATPLSLSITNIGTANLSISSLALTAGNGITNSADFTLGGSCNAAIVPNASCGLTINFTPLAPIGSKVATLVISSNAVNAAQPAGTTNVGLSGLAIPVPAPIIQLSATNIGFGNVINGSILTVQRITLSNVGQLPLNLTNIRATGNYQQTNTCITPMNPSQSCAISITFTPFGIGSQNGSVIITSNATPTINIVPLTGTGCIFLSPSARRFIVNNCGN